MKRKTEIITFKADESLLKAMRGIPNRSSFIRSAVLTALNNTCPLCLGTGKLTPNQQTHWQKFVQNHSFQECDDCHEMHLICMNKTSIENGECVKPQPESKKNNVSEK